MTGRNAWGGAGMFGMFHLLWWGLVIAAIAVFARWLLGSRQQRDTGEDRALAVLRKPFAREEIDKDAFEALKRQPGLTQRGRRSQSSTVACGSA